MRAQARATLEAYYDAFNRGDSAAMAALLTEDVIHDINQGERQVGLAAFEAFLAHMARCYRETLRDITLMVSDDGARAAAELVVEGVYLATDSPLPQATGQTYTLPAGAFFELRQGRIARVTMYYNLQEWLRQIGA